jgi:hypothetical protein
MATDLLLPLMDLPGVTESVTSARERVDALLWDRSLRTKGAALRKDVAIQNARASAAIDGIDIALSAWVTGDAFDDSPIGHAAAGVWRLEQSLPEQVNIWAKAPMQSLARMHSLVARDVVADADRLGRPRDSEDVDDPLRIKSLPDVSSMKVRLAGLAQVTTTQSEAPAIVEAAVVHGELVALRPFEWGSALVARAAARVVLAQRGLDPDLLLLTDAAIYSIGRPAYVDAVRAYLSGTPDGVARWIRFCAESCAVGARLSIDRLPDLD